MHFSLADIIEQETGFRRNLINSITGFKSLGLIGTASSVGVTNVAPFSQIIHVGANPPYIGVLFRPHTVPRNTLQNILEVGSFTVNHVNEEFVNEAHLTSARWSNSEFEATGLTPEFLFDFKAPFVKESKVKFACELKERIDIQSNGTHLIIGEIKHIDIPKGIIGVDGFIDLEAAGTVTASGLDSYHLTKLIRRLPYAKPVKG
ncbi:MAG: flavin reductase (DIM6/NTAB) family NADH-FMN oxidoreductase RutF [Cyclobacteriaceae bacterium]|jgi:flavin reductase (DIM6/NTAB) family NADH-FMN oxidoreductase RutF